jgi:hypothetical protein
MLGIHNPQVVGQVVLEKLLVVGLSELLVELQRELFFLEAYGLLLSAKFTRVYTPLSIVEREQLLVVL